MNRILYIGLFFCFFCCSEEKKTFFIPENNSKIFENKYAFVEVDSMSFPIDSITTFWHYSSAINKIDSDSIYFYSYINSFDHSINYSSLDKQKTKKIFANLKNESKLNLISETSTHLFINPNQFFIYSLDTGKLFHIDSIGNIKNEYGIVDYNNANNTSLVFPEPSSMNPFIKSNDDILFSCGIKSQIDYSGIGMVLKYNLKNNEKKYILPLPQLYNEAFWGSPFKYLPSFALNPNENILAISYPISSYVYRADLNGNIIDSASVGSKYFSKIEPMFNDVEYAIKTDRDYGEEDIFSFSNSDFSKLIYDRYKNLYYRVAFIRPNENEVKIGDKIPDFSIIITDNNLKKIGESKFSGKIYDVSMMSVTEHGIWLPRKDYYTLDQSKIIFSLFELKKI